MSNLQHTNDNLFSESDAQRAIPPPSRAGLLLPASILAAGIMIAGAVYIAGGGLPSGGSAGGGDGAAGRPATLEEAVLPSGGVTLPVTWGDLGSKLTAAGAIDAERFQALYEERGVFTDEYRKLLLGQSDEKLVITNDNAGYLLNLFWAFGLANKNSILETGEMRDPRYGGAGKFASTGGWTMARGNAMNHYSVHELIALSPEEQALVDRVSKGIYRPCCGNSTHFPDCNHGMAMLGILELMASQGAGEPDMWKAALAVNSYWFPETYITIATYMKGRGVEWKDVNPQEVLGANFSSAQGYANIAAQVTEPQLERSGSGCGVSAGNEAVPARQQGGCGI